MCKPLHAPFTAHCPDDADQLVAFLPSKFETPCELAQTTTWHLLRVSSVALECCYKEWELLPCFRESIGI